MILLLKAAVFCNEETHGFCPILRFCGSCPTGKSYRNMVTRQVIITHTSRSTSQLGHFTSLMFVVYIDSSFMVKAFHPKALRILTPQEWLFWGPVFPDPCYLLSGKNNLFQRNLFHLEPNFAERVTPPPPKTNEWQWKSNHEWRCISPIKMVMFHCHVSFQGGSTINPQLFWQPIFWSHSHPPNYFSIPQFEGHFPEVLGHECKQKVTRVAKTLVCGSKGTKLLYFRALCLKNQPEKKRLPPETQVLQSFCWGDNGRKNAGRTLWRSYLCFFG